MSLREHFDKLNAPLSDLMNDFFGGCRISVYKQNKVAEEVIEPVEMLEATVKCNNAGTCRQTGLKTQ